MKKYFLNFVMFVIICAALFSTCKKEIPVTGVTINIEHTAIGVGDTLQLVATVYPENATNKNVSWKSYNPNKATVDENGLVTAINIGENNNSIQIQVITQDGNKTASCILDIVENGGPTIVPVTGVTLSKTALNLEIDKTETLIATVQPENATNKNVTWTSEQPAVATVSSSGVVTAISKGMANIIVSTQSGYYSANCSVSVKPEEPEEYRAKWVGSYDCEEIYHWWQLISNPNPPPPLIDTSWGGVYQTIVVIEAIGDSSLKITENRYNRKYETKVDRSGFGGIPLNHGFLEITFEKDSLKMTTMYGMMGYSTSSIYKGKKLKTKKQ